MRDFRRIFIVASIFLFLSRAVYPIAQGRICTKAEAMAAEESVGRLSSWIKIYNSFKRFGHCDDGAIAEGYSDSIVRTLANRWRQLNRLSKFASSDRAFHDFVLAHIDATTDEYDLRKVLANASKRCPHQTRTLCIEIEKAARDALHDIR